MEKVRELIVSRPILMLGLTNATTAFVGIYLHARKEGGIKKLLYRWIFSISFAALKVVAKDTVDAERNKMKAKTREMVLKHVEGERYQVLPAKGMPKDKVIKLLKDISGKETKWRDGMISGTVYHGGDDTTQVISAAFSEFAVSNVRRRGKGLACSALTLHSAAASRRVSEHSQDGGGDCADVL